MANPTRAALAVASVHATCLAEALSEALASSGRDTNTPAEVVDIIDEALRELHEIRERSVIESRRHLDAAMERSAAWAVSLTVDAKTAEGIASRLRAHLLPAFGDLELRHIKPSTVQGWLGGLARTREPSYVRLLLGTLSTILGAAVEDGLIPSNPCRSRSVKAPALPDARRDAWDPSPLMRCGTVCPSVIGRSSRWAPASGCGKGRCSGSVST